MWDTDHIRGASSGTWQLITLFTWRIFLAADLAVTNLWRRSPEESRKSGGGGVYLLKTTQWRERERESDNPSSTTKTCAGHTIGDLSVAAEPGRDRVAEPGRPLEAEEGRDPYADAGRPREADDGLSESMCLCDAADEGRLPRLESPFPCCIRPHHHHPLHEGHRESHSQYNLLMHR